MSDILVQISKAPGEAAAASYQGQIECTSARHVVDLPVVSTSADRTEGNSGHGAYELTHSIDNATPHLREALAKGTNLGKAVISIMQTIAGKYQAGQTITLNDIYVTEMRVETPLDPETGLPSEEPQEMFALTYSGITWETKVPGDNNTTSTVSGTYNLVSRTAE